VLEENRKGVVKEERREFGKRGTAKRLEKKSGVNRGHTVTYGGTGRVEVQEENPRDL